MTPKFTRLYKKRAKIAKALRSQNIFSFLYVATAIFKNRLIQRFRDLKYSYKDSSLPKLTPVKAVKRQPVTIIMPFRDGVELTKTCLTSVFEKTTYKDYRFILINNLSIKPETLAYIEVLKKDSRITIIDYPKPYNYSDMHNIAMDLVQTENVLLLNNDTEVISPDWLESMVAWIEQDKVGAVGALLLFPNGTVQHGGVGIYPEVTSHLYEGELPDGPKKAEINQTRELYAVTAACLMTKKSLYQEVGGMDSENLPINLNDIDYCLRLGRAGYRVIFDAQAKLFHHEAITRGSAWMNISKYRLYRKEYKFFWNKWRRYVEDKIV